MFLHLIHQTIVYKVTMWIISIIIFQPHGYWRVTMWVWVAMWTPPHVDLIIVSNGTGGSYSFYKWKSLIETYLYNLVLSQFQWGKYFHLYMFLSQIECIHIWSKNMWMWIWSIINYITATEKMWGWECTAPSTTGTGWRTCWRTSRWRGSMSRRIMRLSVLDGLCLELGVKVGDYCYYFYLYYSDKVFTKTWLISK